MLDVICLRTQPPWISLAPISTWVWAINRVWHRNPEEKIVWQPEWHQEVPRDKNNKRNDEIKFIQAPSGKYKRDI